MPLFLTLIAHSIFLVVFVSLDITNLVGQLDGTIRLSRAGCVIEKKIFLDFILLRGCITCYLLHALRATYFFKKYRSNVFDFRQVNPFAIVIVCGLFPIFESTPSEQ